MLVAHPVTIAKLAIRGLCNRNTLNKHLLQRIVEPWLGLVFITLDAQIASWAGVSGRSSALQRFKVY